MLPIQNAASLRESLLQSRSLAAVQPAPEAGSADVFGGVLHAVAQQIQTTESKAQGAVIGLLSGQGVDVHDAMIATQQADLTLELALQVRNKAVAAYQQMMTMQF